MNFQRRSICDPESIRLRTEDANRPSVVEFNLSRRSRADRSAKNNSKTPSSYIDAMKALQEKLEQLKLENQFLCDNNVINLKNNQRFSSKIELKKENEYLKDLVELLTKNEQLLKVRQEELENKIKTLISEQAASIRQESLESYENEIQLLKGRNEQILRQLENYKDIEQKELERQIFIEQEKELSFLKNTFKAPSIVPINKSLRSHLDSQNENTMDSLLQDFEISQQKYNQLNTQLMGKFKFIGRDFLKNQKRPLSELTSTQNSSGMKRQFKPQNKDYEDLNRKISEFQQNKYQKTDGQKIHDYADLNRKLSEYQVKRNQQKDRHNNDEFNVLNRKQSEYQERNNFKNSVSQYSILKERLQRCSSTYKGNHYKPQFNYYDRDGSLLSRNDFSIEKIRNSSVDILQK